MVIRIRFGKGPKIGVRRRKTRRAALMLSALLTPAAAMALALACWRIAADLNWTSSFAIPSGLFSHWQAWLGAAVLLQVVARVLNRYARNGDAATS
jgi:TRAP-type C4-dicarboxylate transport system permease small subunit